jgi:hypothetical protein
LSKQLFISPVEEGSNQFEKLVLVEDTLYVTVETLHEVVIKGVILQGVSKFLKKGVLCSWQGFKLP